MIVAKTITRIVMILGVGALLYHDIEAYMGFVSLMGILIFVIPSAVCAIIPKKWLYDGTLHVTDDGETEHWRFSVNSNPDLLKGQDELLIYVKHEGGNK